MTVEFIKAGKINKQEIRNSVQEWKNPAFG